MIVLPARAQTQIETQAWVQAVATGGYETRVITGNKNCPVRSKTQCHDAPSAPATTIATPNNARITLRRRAKTRKRLIERVLAPMKTRSAVDKAYSCPPSRRASVTDAASRAIYQLPLDSTYAQS